MSLNWLISFKDPRVLFEDNWIALVLEVVSIALFLHVCIHAKRNGSKAFFFVVTLVLSSVGLEIIQQIPHTGYELWWYHEGTVNFLHQRVPLYIICFDTVFYYYVHLLTKGLKLPSISQSVVTVITVMLLLFPCLAIAPHLLLCLVHNDDAIFHHRIFNVPYAQMITLILCFFHSGHLYQNSWHNLEPEDHHFFGHLWCALKSGLSATIFSFVEIYLLYVFFTITLDLHPCFCLFAVFAILTFKAAMEVKEVDFKKFTKIESTRIVRCKEWWLLVAFFVFVVSIPMIVNPENLRSNGVHQEFGPCDVMEYANNVSPLKTPRRHYVCPNGTEDLGFDFHCVPKEVLSTTAVKRSYTICGIPFQNKGLLTTKMTVYSSFALGILHWLLTYSFAGENGKKIEKKKE